MAVAVLGLGLMGRAIAQRLLHQGYVVWGWNRTRGPGEELQAQGLQLAATPAEALAEARWGLLVLSDAAAIRETLFRTAPPLDLSGRTLVQMGTIAPAESRVLALEASARGGAYLEAPVLGSLPEAREGRLIVMAGGELEVFQDSLPLLQTLGQNPQLIGPVGQGAALKLAMNQLIGGLTASFALSLGLVRAEGIEVGQFMTLLRASALYAPTFDKKLPKYLAHDYAAANFPLKHLLKDLCLFQQVAAAVGLDPAPTAAVAAACERGVEHGLGDQDYSSLYETLVGRV